jgi:hypothetical protein
MNTPLKHLQPCTIDQLKEGDRFYKANDKKKQRYTVLPSPVIKTYFRTYKYFAMLDNDRHPTPIMKTTPLVFLRSTK